MSTLLIKFLFYSVVFLNVNILAESIDDLKQKYAEMIMNCAKDYPITAEDVEQLKNKQLPDNENVKCLFACAYKTAGMMDDQGKLSVEGVNKLAQMYLSDDPERLKKAEQFTDACKEVNDVSVSDGSKGCERAALIFKCSVEKASQFDLVL